MMADRFSSQTGRKFTLNFTGDVMLGRLIDQLFPTHVSNDREASIAAHFKERYPSTLRSYSHRSPWGNTLDLFHSADLNLINLETSVTTVATPWPDKAFNYRMHPANVAALLEARIDYVSLANNHTVDFGAEGLVETVWTLKETRRRQRRTGAADRGWARPIAFAGAGETTVECFRPAELRLPRPDDAGGGDEGRTSSPHTGLASSSLEDKQKAVAEEKQKKQEETAMPQAGGQEPSLSYAVHVYSASDHPQDWAVVPTFHLIDYSASTRQKLKYLLTTNAYRTPQWAADAHATDPGSISRSRDNKTNEAKVEETSGDNKTGSPDAANKARQFNFKPDLKVFSIHWGPNYAWLPDDEIQSLAHFLIDECGVDIIHGHSAHHVQGVEVYKGKLIIYGCGDFVDDYAVNDAYRNDLGALWRVSVRERVSAGSGSTTNNDGADAGKVMVLELDQLEVFPTRIQSFQTNLLDENDEDHTWVRTKITRLSEALGTRVRSELGAQGQMIIDIRG